MNIIVVGAGVVGVTTAHALAKDGHSVQVIERREGVGLETSFANGGQVSANHAEPWASPKVLPQVLAWLGRHDAPLLYRLRLDPALWSWSLSFLANCTSKREKLNMARILRVALYSRETLKALRASEDLSYEDLHNGILNVYGNEADFAQGREAALVMADLGFERRVLTTEECLDVEPSLQHATRPITGASLSPDDESGNAYLFTEQLAERAKALGVTFTFNTSLSHLIAEKRRVIGVATDQGHFSADAVVLAAGSYSPAFLRPLGLKLPIYPAKGYSVSIPITDPDCAPSVSITDQAQKLVFSRLGDVLRVAGTAEFAGYNTDIDPERAQLTLDGALGLFPKAGDGAKATYWTGLRPATPDGVPILGETAFDNLYLNSGHGTLGWTMAAGSARIVADVIAGRTPGVDLDGLGLSRFF